MTGGTRLRLSSLARTAGEIVNGAEPGLGGATQSSLALHGRRAVSGAAGQLLDARDELQRALSLRRRQFGISPWPTVEILLRLAAVLSGTGDGPAAISLLAEARDELTGSPDGAGVQLARLDQLEQRLRGKRRRAGRAGPLTERELAVLRLLRGSLSLREIGRQVTLRGECGSLVAALFADAAIESGRGRTCVTFTVRDDCELYGLLDRVQDLALHLISLIELGTDVYAGDAWQSLM